VLPPFSAMDTCVCMGASIGVDLGLRHVLPEEQARWVVSVIGDSTFVHSGIAGIAELVYNPPPPTGHLVLILDDGTTATTGLQEHPGTGRALDHSPTNRLDCAALARAMGVQNVHVVQINDTKSSRKDLIANVLARAELSLVVARQPCVLAAPKIRVQDEATLEAQQGEPCAAIDADA
jgi:indolepyruvate ferredoxin oxidoreductase, alpha subunit